MSKKSVIKMTALAAAFAATAAPMAASAEVTGSLSAASFYLWRGTDISGGTAQIAGDLNFSTEAGFYAGTWISSAGTPVGVAGIVADDPGTADTEIVGVGSTSTETDFYAGFGTEVGGLGVDISYWTYVYPEADIGAGEVAEVILGLSMADFSLTTYASANNLSDSDKENFGDDLYITAGYSYDKFGFIVGTWMYDADDSDYTHADVSYSPVENLTFTVSKVIDADLDLVEDQDPLFHVGYSFPL